MFGNLCIIYKTQSDTVPAECLNCGSKQVIFSLYKNYRKHVYLDIFAEFLQNIAMGGTTFPHQGGPSGAPKLTENL